MLIGRMIRLYRAPYSTNVQRVTMALTHKRLPHEDVWISYADRSAVVAVSGQELVPVAVVGEEVVAGSMAIVRRLDELHPDPSLYPADPARRAAVELFVDWFERVWKVAPNAIEAGGDVAGLASLMADQLDLFEALLTRRAFLFGDFGAADCCAYPFLKYAAGRDPDDDEPFHRILAEHQSVDGRPNLAGWIERCAPRAPDRR